MELNSNKPKKIKSYENDSKKSLTNKNPWLKRWLTRRLEIIDEDWEGENRQNSDDSINLSRSLKNRTLCRSRQQSFDSTSVSTRPDDAEAGQLSLNEIKFLADISQKTEEKGLPFHNISFIKLKQELQNFCDTIDNKNKIKENRIKNLTPKIKTEKKLNSEITHSCKNRKKKSKFKRPILNNLKPEIDSELDLNKLTNLENKIKELSLNLVSDYDKNNKDLGIGNYETYCKSISEKTKFVQKKLYNMTGKKILESILRELVFSTFCYDKAKFLVLEISILEHAKNIISLIKNIEHSQSQVLDIITIKDSVLEIKKHIATLKNFGSDYDSDYENFIKNIKFMRDILFVTSDKITDKTNVKIKNLSAITNEIKKLKSKLKHLSNCIDIVIDFIENRIEIPSLVMDIEKNYKCEFEFISNILSSYEKQKVNKNKINNVKPRNLPNKTEREINQ